MSKFTVADIFAGAGGLSLGFMDEGFDPLWAFEWNEDAALTYYHNHNGVTVYPDVQAGDPVALTRPDVLVGGPPCQDFTQLRAVREDQSTDRNNMLWNEYLRYVKGLRPRVFVIENVPNIFRHPEFAELKQQAADWDYQLAYGVLKASDFGVPQDRERAFIIGCRERMPFLPPPTLKSFSAVEAISNPPGPLRDGWPEGDGPWRVDQLHIRRKPNVVSRLRYRYVVEEGNRLHLPDAITIRSWVDKQGTYDGYGRLFLDRPSPTIRCEPYKPEKGRYLHPWEDRPLTLWEAATLQTFPPDFAFYGSLTSVAKQIGNAVPPRLAGHIAKAVQVVLRPEQIDLDTLRTPAWQPTARTGTAPVLKAFREHGINREMTAAALAAAAGTRDWRSALHQLVENGYRLAQVRYGSYKLEAAEPTAPGERPSARRLRAVRILRHKRCEACGSKHDLEPVVLPWPGVDGPILYENIRVLCITCRDEAELVNRPPDLSDLVTFIQETWSVPRIRTALVRALELTPVEVRLLEDRQGRPPAEENEEALLAWAREDHKDCYLCGAVPVTVYPIIPNGLRRRENVWALCDRCHQELQEEILYPTRDKLIDRFAWESFLTPFEARLVNRIARLKQVGHARQALVGALLGGELGGGE
jgi:DNA (cytosine-5)-methyltransferase 1